MFVGRPAVVVVALVLVPAVIIMTGLTTADAMAVRTTSETITSAASPKCQHSERLSPWTNRWSENRIGWHLPNVHESLQKFGDHIIPEWRTTATSSDKEEKVADDDVCSAKRNDTRVLVSLSGKTVDMAFLAAHPGVQEVVGVDGVHKAFEEFTQEHPHLGIKKKDEYSNSTLFEEYSGKGISLWRGDFFDLTIAGHAENSFHAVFDRGSLVAVDPTLREQYARVMKHVLKPGGKILLVVLDRRSGTEESRMRGPPFSVEEAEVRRLYEGQDWVESVTLLEEIDMFARDPNAEKRYEGLTSFFEMTFLIQAKA